MLIVHTMYLTMLGIKHIVVLVNKMDESSIMYANTQYNTVKEEFSKLLTKVGFKRTLICIHMQHHHIIHRPSTLTSSSS